MWQRQVGNPGAVGNGDCITSAAYDGPSAMLYVAANHTTLDGVERAWARSGPSNPSTGAVRWERPLPCLPTGSPTVNATTHVVAVPLYDAAVPTPAASSLFNATTGEPLRTITTVGKVFAQPVFANGKLFVADGSGRLTAFEP